MNISSIFVPLVGLVFPAISIIAFFIYIESEDLD